MGVLKADLLNLGGGYNGGIPAHAIEDTEMADLRNFYPFGPKLVRRLGTSKIHTNAYTEQVTSLFAYKADLGAWTLLVGTLTGIARKDGQSLVALSVPAGVSYPPSTAPWLGEQYLDVAYFVRKATGGMKRSSSTFFHDAGISRPGSAPTLVQGAAGVHSAGDYYGVTTFRNLLTGAESNPSDPSLVCTIAGSKRMAWSAIATSVELQVNGRSLYRVLTDQQAEYYWVATLTDNFTTTYDDNVAIADMGQQASYRNGLPPSNTSIIEVWNERVWLSDEGAVYYSQFVMPESHYSASIIQVYPDDGHKIVQLLAFGDRLMVFKTNATHFIVGTDASNFTRQTLSDKHGCVAPLSAKTAEGLLFWFSGENFYRSDGTNVDSISTTKIRNLIDNIPKAQLKNVTASVDARQGWYIATIAQNSDTHPSLRIIHNYKTGAWHVDDFPSALQAPTFMGDFYDSNGAPLRYGVFSDQGGSQHKHVYDLLAGLKDDGAAIDAYFVTKAFGMGAEGFMKAGRRVQINCQQTAAEATIGWLLNGGSSLHRGGRSVSLYHPEQWKRYSLSSADQLASTLQLKFAYSGAPALDVEGVIFETVATKRMGKVR